MRLMGWSFGSAAGKASDCDDESFQPFLFKTLRNDSHCFMRTFIRSLVDDKSSPLRHSQRRNWTVRLGLPDRVTGVRQYEVVSTCVANRPSLFGAQKIGFTKHQSCTYADPRRGFLPPPFGYDSRLLVGMRFSLDACLVQRIFRGDIGTLHRPYDTDSKEKAETLPKKLSMCASFSELVATGSRYSTNEVMARLTSRIQDSMQVMIFSDTLEARLLAQLRALDLAANLQRKYRWNKPILISFYPALRYYTEQEQAADRKKVDPCSNLFPYVLAINAYLNKFKKLSLDDLQKIIPLCEKLSDHALHQCLKGFLYLVAEFQWVVEPQKVRLIMDAAGESNIFDYYNINYWILFLCPNEGRESLLCDRSVSIGFIRGLVKSLMRYYGNYFLEHAYGILRNVKAWENYAPQQDESSRVFGFIASYITTPEEFFELVAGLNLTVKNKLLANVPAELLENLFECHFGKLFPNASDFFQFWQWDLSEDQQIRLHDAAYRQLSALEFTGKDIERALKVFSDSHLLACQPVAYGEHVKRAVCERNLPEIERLVLAYDSHPYLPNDGYDFKLKFWFQQPLLECHRYFLRFRSLNQPNRFKTIQEIFWELWYADEWYKKIFFQLPSAQRWLNKFAQPSAVCELFVILVKTKHPSVEINQALVLLLKMVPRSRRWETVELLKEHEKFVDLIRDDAVFTELLSLFDIQIERDYVLSLRCSPVSPFSLFFMSSQNSSPNFVSSVQLLAAPTQA